MKKVHLFIAMSLDGYIADYTGRVDWLQGEQPEQDDMQSYKEFIQDIDTVIMGYTTYHQITSELMKEEPWFYTGLTTYVLTHQKIADTKEIFFVHENTISLIKRLREEAGKDIWICGGPSIVQPLRQADLIDRYYISIIPTLLGKGVPLFSPCERELPLKLVETKHYNGIVDVVYERRISG